MKRYEKLIDNGHFAWTPRLFGLIVTRTIFDCFELHLRWGRFSLNIHIHRKGEE